VGIDHHLSRNGCIPETQIRKSENSMNITLATRLIIYWKTYALLGICIVMLITGSLVAFPISYFTSASVLIGILLFPFCFHIENKPRVNTLLLFLTVAMAAFAVRYHVKIFYFYAVALAIVVVFELLFGKVNNLVLFLVVAMSPVFHQVSVIAGFPIRLYLSEIAGQLLDLAGFNVGVSGNVMETNGFEFSVDDACMGLNMLAISFLIAIYLVGYFYRQYNKKLSPLYLFGFFATVLALNMANNLFRIILLTLFKIPPQNPLHDIIGMLCLILYVIIPVFFVARYMVSRHAGNVQVVSGSLELTAFKKTIALSFALFVAACGFFVNSERSTSWAHADVHENVLKKELLDDGITKLSDPSLLAYIKPIPEFFSGEHTPLLCWKGSGFTFRKIQQQIYHGTTIYTGILQKENELLFTAWWYTNGEIVTTSQMEWRSRMLFEQEKFALVNVTASNEESLSQNIEKALSWKIEMP
jgi:exosortase N